MKFVIAFDTLYYLMKDEKFYICNFCSCFGFLTILNLNFYTRLHIETSLYIYVK